MSFLRPARWFLLAALALPGAGRAQAPAPVIAATVPVREAVLFSSGVGYFQHEGTVRGDAETELRFKTGQINDILKSLVLQDLDGGRVGAVTYPSQDPLEKTLGSFQINLGDNPGLGDLLNQLRGARVGVSVGGETLAGIVLGVEKKIVAKDKDGQAIEKSFLNLLADGAGIRAVSLDDVRTVRLEDAGLQEELNKALAALAGARDQDKKPVALHFTGQGERRVRVGYVVETPIWKASYRLLLPDEGAEGGKATLQGWAIVENQTDSDWNNVRLSLVSGRPISFRQDLYQSLYVPRPEVRPELYSSLRPQTYEAGQEKPEETSAPGEAAVVARIRKRPPPGFVPPPSARRSPASSGEAQAEDAPAPVEDMTFAEPAPAPPSPARPAPLDAAQSIATAAQTAQLGELFQYTVPSVTLPRQRSAMIPILNDPVEAEKVSIFNERTLARFALNGARLKADATTKKSLLQGPVSVFEGGRYVGDASLGDVPAGQSRLLSYGIDLQLTVQPRESPQPAVLQTGKIVSGLLEVSWKRRARREYVAENKGEHPKRLVIEHPRRGGDEWRLTDTPAPVETLPALLRFELSVPPGKTDFAVQEETTDAQRILLTETGNLPNAVWYSQQGEIPPPVRAALVRAATLQRAAADTERQMNERLAQVQTITEEQNRLRENLKTVDKGNAYAARLLKKLDEQESQIERLRGDAEALRGKLETQRRELAEYLKGVNIG